MVCLPAPLAVSASLHLCLLHLSPSIGGRVPVKFLSPENLGKWNLCWIHFAKIFGPFFSSPLWAIVWDFFAFAGIVPASKFCLVGGALFGVRFQHILLDIDDDEDDEHEENQKDDEDDEDEDEDDEDDDENEDDDEFEDDKR